MTFSSALLVTIFTIGGGTPAQMTEDLEKIFDDESYAFCNDEKLALFPMEREYCEVVGKHNEVCPALPEVCKNELPKDFKWTQRGRTRVGREGADYGPKDDKPDDGEETDGSGNGRHGNGSGDGSGSGSGKDGSGKGKDGSSGKDGSGKGKDGSSGKDGSGKGKDSPKESSDKGKDDSAKSPPPPPEEPSPPMQIPGWVAGLFRILFYLLIAALLGVIGYYIYKNLMEGREDKDKPDDAPPDDAPNEEAPQVPRGPVETDVERLLARARAAAQRGDFKQAIEDSYAALLRRLEGDGIIDLHPSRTNGDYVRSLRDRDELRQAVRGIATDVEKVQFGSETPNPTLFESVYNRVLPLCGRIAAIALLLLAAGNLSSCDDAGRRPADPDVLMLGGGVKKGGASGSGLGAIAEILKKNDIDTSFVLTKDQEAKGGAKGIVLMPGAKVDRDQWKALRSWVRDGGTLILAGHRSDLSKDFRIEEAPSAGPGPIRTVPGSVYDAYGHELALPYVSQLTGSFSRWETILTRGKEPYALLNGDYDAVGGGRIIVFADDRLFSNLAMALGDNASYLVTLLKRCDVKDLEFWDSIRGSSGGGAGDGSGSGSGDGSSGGEDGGDEGASGGGEGADNPIDSIKNARLLPILLQLLALVLLFVLWKGTRFGTPRDPKEESRRAFADHTRALGMTYARANASRHASGLFSVWAIDRLRERLLGGARGSLSQLAEAIALRTGRPIGEVMQVLMEATGAREEVAPPSSFRPGASAAPPPQSPPHAPPQSGSARDFWIMEELSRYLAATKSATKVRGKR